MAKKYLILFLALFFAAKCYLGDGTPLPSHTVLFTSQSGDCVIKYKLSKEEVKPFSKIHKTKLKVRYKASEVKFSLNVFNFENKATFYTLKHLGNCELSFLESGFQYLVKLRGPPLAI